MLIYAESAVRRCSSKYMFLKFRNTHRETSVLETLFNKEISTPVFSCSYCEVFTNSFF